MKKEIIECSAINEKYYKLSHESGLTILLYPMAGFSSSFALFGTKYGSIDTTFKTQNDADFETVPEGIAHFLEHKLFESEDGDAFELFSKTGACANAFTSFDKTCYLFSATQKFEESLSILIKFVQSPYFTQKTVEKEQGIIGQEIRMYDDDPDNNVFYGLLEALYQNNPVRINIAGTVSSIAKIDADLLYKCYKTFYNLNNMTVAVAGNFDVETAINIIEKNLKPCEKIEVTTQTPEEPRQIVTKTVEKEFEVSIPLFNFGYKEVSVKEDLELEYQMKYGIIINIIAGKASDLYKEMYNNSLINSTFSSEVFSGRGFLSVIFGGESHNPYEVMERVKKEIVKYKENGIDNETFERVKKSTYGRAIMNFNDVEDIATDLLSMHMTNNNIYDTITILSKLKLEDINELLKLSFNEEYLAISIINPIKTATEE